MHWSLQRFTWHAWTIRSHLHNYKPNRDLKPPPTSPPTDLQIIYTYMFSKYMSCTCRQSYIRTHTHTGAHTRDRETSNLYSDTFANTLIYTCTCTHTYTCMLMNVQLYQTVSIQAPLSPLFLRMSASRHT